MGHSASKNSVPVSQSSGFGSTPVFGRERALVLASVVFQQKTLMCFASTRSFDCYARGHKEFQIRNDGLGFPTLTMESARPLQCLLETGDPAFRIYQYFLRTASEPAPHPECQIARHSGDKLIYKALLCNVYELESPVRDAGYELIFPDMPRPTSVRLEKYKGSLRMGADLGGWGAQWICTSGSPLLPKELVLVALQGGDNMPSKAKSSSILGTRQWAKYREFFSALPSRSAEKVASLCVRDVELSESEVSACGIGEVPWYTRVIACMGLMMCHLHEQKKRNRGKNSPFSAASHLRSAPLVASSVNSPAFC
ncbi:LAQU0S12e01002g1_1 [Lachancea quebecensis]|uniref:LAQU0S12e01002g1_1 n=1 Tax=Lachancea quebecensis TaxID=1654605 RepID=A0A0N7MM15_9SACH|nr:LAQU0S12e01002g1_1 [Lachancea quebecensis]